tara:strand:+ start:32732 stop:35059 length:2328 start_codon:yes stop_codon:yes gene_type:complete
LKNSKWFQLLSLAAFLPAFFIWQSGGHRSAEDFGRFPANFASENCFDVIRELSDIDLSRTARTLRAPHGYSLNQLEPGEQLQFGFESEYMLSELDGLVTVYGPKEEFGISKEDWFNMPVTDRSQWVRDHIDQLFPEARVSGGLVKLDSDPELDFLPESLIFDDTGNVEIVMDPLDSFEQWYHSVKILNQRFGNGSMQATISTPPDSFFGRSIDGLDPEQVLEEKIGFFNFYSDYDILQKLSAAHSRYSSDNSKRVTRNFEHPFLGPMTLQKQNLLHSILRGNAVGQKYEPERLERIAGWENSYKYTGGTVYRPDILGERKVILEVRDAHKNFPLLTDRLLRSLFFMQHGTKGFDQLNQLKSYDPIEDFEKLPQKVRVGLEELFPNKANPNYEYSDDIKFSLDVFRNFAYPMRDWSNHLEALNATHLQQQVAEAQMAYQDKLKRIFKHRKNGIISDEEASTQVQGALARFSNDSGISKAFENYEDQIIFGGTRGDDFSNFHYIAQMEAGPLQNAFPEEIWDGPLLDRIEFLTGKYATHMKSFDQVDLKFNGSDGRSRNVYVVSFKGMDEAEKEHFLEDYYKAASLNTISFPLGESPGHLYTRFGNKTYDFITSVSEAEYRAPNSDRLEVFMELEPDEFTRMRTYIENARGNTAHVLGGFSYGGVDGPTGGKLDMNRPGSFNSESGVFSPTSGEGHNCTSWICTAPIGDNGESLHDLAGAPRAHRVHTNPGWWSMWLANYGKRERVPFAVMFTDDSLEQVTETIENNGLRGWRFDPH